MNQQYVVGIDAGTTGCRAVIFDLTGREVGSGYRENPLEYPQAGWVELDPEALIVNCYEAMREALRTASINANDIKSVCFTMMRPCLIMRDEHGNYTRNMIMWQDMRSAKMLPWMEERLAEHGMTADDLYDITGMPLSTVWTAPRIYWVKENEPEVWERTTLVHNAMAQLLKAFGADEYIDDTDDLNWWQINDANSFEYDAKLAEVFGVDLDKYSKHVPSGTVVGAVTPDVAMQTGLAVGTPLVMGSGDHQCAAVGMGNVREGMASLVLGTAGVVVAQSDHPVRDPNRKAHVVGSALHKWEIEGHASAAASSFKWVQDTFGDLEKAAAKSTGVSTYEMLTQVAGRAEAGSQGLVFVPWLAGAACPFYNPEARGAFVGLTFGHSKAEILRSTLEGVCFEMRSMIATMASAGLPDFEFFRISGGAARSKLWNQIAADIYGRPVETVGCAEATALGAAMIGAVGVGLFDDLVQASEQMVHVGSRYEPLTKNISRYNEMYEVFLTTYEALEGGGVFGKVARAQGL